VDRARLHSRYPGALAAVDECLAGTPSALLHNDGCHDHMRDGQGDAHGVIVAVPCLFGWWPPVTALAPLRQSV